MTISGRILSKEIIEHWPEVFNDVELNVLPLKYLQAVLINFKDGKTWEIRITTSTKKEGWQVFEKNLSDLCRSYEHRIDNIDFKIDTLKIRKDIEQSTKKFLKKKKL
ncbi:MAG: hypothetical protein RLZZ196_627 [Bacteroidota bacterium]